MLFLEAASLTLEASCIVFPTIFLPKRIALLFPSWKASPAHETDHSRLLAPTQEQCVLLRPRPHAGSALLLVGGATGRLSLAPTLSWVSKAQHAQETMS